MEFYIAQAIGLVVTGLSLVVQHFKKMHRILVMEALVNFLAGVQYLLLAGYSGACISMIGSVNVLCMLAYRKFGNQDSRFVPNLMCVVFGVIHIAFGVWSAYAWYDVFPILGAVFATLAVVQSKAGYYRILRVANAAVWITYCVCSGAYTMILMQSLSICSGVAAILRLDVKRKEKDTV